MQQKSKKLTISIIEINTRQITDTMEPGEREEASMEDSESQILHPLNSGTTSATRRMKADFPIMEGNLLDASSKDWISFCSLISKSVEEIKDGVRGDGD